MFRYHPDHCADAAMFLGRVGYQELRAVENDQHVRSLHPDGDTTGHLLRCHHCGAHLAYTDMS
jgi:uncharacterized protein CbrC (UPF0167 family)